VKILFDQGVPVPLRGHLPEHKVTTAYERGWSSLKNGELLRLADEEFDALITTDKRLRFQQNLTGLRIAILVLPTTSWPKIKANVKAVAASVDALRPGEVLEILFP
jgi:hypothetical protein